MEYHAEIEHGGLIGMGRLPCRWITAARSLFNSENPFGDLP
jgi:hypothetical protein